MKLTTKVTPMFLSNPSRPVARINASTGLRPWPSLANQQPRSAAGSEPRRAGPGLAACFLGLVLLMTLAPGLRAQEQVVVPELVNYQGRLESLDTNKTYMDGLYDIDFRVWDSANSTNSGLLWAETYSVYVKGGNFNVVLGESGSPLKTPLTPAYRTLRSVFHTASGSTDRYLAITVKEDETRTPISIPVECAPRQQMLSAPFAFQAQYAQYAASAGAGTFYATNGLQVTGGSLSANAMVLCYSGLIVSGGKADIQNGLQVEGPTHLTGGLQVDGALTTMTAGIDVSGQSTLRGNVNIVGTTTGGGFVPVGGIIMWSGTVANVPTGWALCDGASHDGVPTPDLRGRFVLSQGTGVVGLTTRNVGDTGGQEYRTITINQMPAHTHTRTVNTVGYSATWAGNSTATAAPQQSKNNGSQQYTTDSAGGGSALPTMPPYYVLAFIIRVQ